MASVSCADLAADLGVDPGDVLTLLHQLDHDGCDLINGELASFLRDLLDPHGERTAPAGFYWPGQVEVPREWGPLGPDPTAAEVDYPPL